MQIPQKASVFLLSAVEGVSCAVARGPADSRVFSKQAQFSRVAEESLQSLHISISYAIKISVLFTAPCLPSACLPDVATVYNKRAFRS